MPYLPEWAKACLDEMAASAKVLDESRNAFSKAIEETAKRFDEAAKG